LGGPFSTMGSTKWTTPGTERTMVQIIKNVTRNSKIQLFLLCKKNILIVFYFYP
jgi:hypothetical protein